MATANSISINGEPTTQNRARAAIEAYASKAAEPPIRLEPIPVRRGKHLDVDAVLVRSLPRVVGE